MTSVPTIERTPPRSQHRHRPSTAENRPKSVLFCDCGREAPADQWESIPTDGRRRLRCPDCGATLTVR